MDTVLVIVKDVITNQPAQVIFIQDDHMVQQFRAAAPDPTLRDSILPGTLKAGSDQLVPKCLSISDACPAYLRSPSRIK